MARAVQSVIHCTAVTHVHLHTLEGTQHLHLSCPRADLRAALSTLRAEDLKVHRLDPQNAPQEARSDPVIALIDQTEHILPRSSTLTAACNT